MAHGPLPPIPILILPKEVADELLGDKVAIVSRNPIGEFSSGEWWMGLLIFSNDASSAITLIKGALSIPHLAATIHDWNVHRELEEHSRSDDSKNPSRTFRYKSPKGQATLELDSLPSLGQLTAWLEAAYGILEDDAKLRENPLPHSQIQDETSSND